MKYLISYPIAVIFAVLDKCSQPAKEAGSCYDYVLRYSYVSSSGRCDAFYYGGCEGNDNRFESSEECEAECIMGATTTQRRPPQRTTERPDEWQTLPPIGRLSLRYYFRQMYFVRSRWKLSGQSANFQFRAWTSLRSSLTSFSSSYHSAEPILLLPTGCMKWNNEGIKSG